MIIVCGGAIVGIIVGLGGAMCGVWWGLVERVKGARGD